LSSLNASLRRPGILPLLAGLGLYTMSFLLFYPRTFAIVDENAYLTQALLFRTGHVSYEHSSIPAPHMTVEHDGRLVSKYPPGNALFLLPFVLMGWRAVFLSGLVLALAGTGLFGLVLRRLAPRADPAWSLLYLFYPAVVLFSRTVMSDLLAGTAVLAGFYFLLRGRPWLLAAGLALGFACLVRYSNVVLLLVALTLVASGPRPRLGPVAALVTGCVPFALVIPAYDAYAFGGPFAFPMYLTGFFSPAFFARNLAYYVPSLLLLYPLMLCAPLLVRRGMRLFLALPAYLLLLLYCFFSFVYESTSWAERLTVGMRYLLPAIPFFVLGFAVVADRIVRRLRGGDSIKYVGIALMFILSVAIQYKHDQRLRIQDYYRRQLYEHVPASALLVSSSEASKLVSYAWGWRDYRLFAEFNVPLPLELEGQPGRPLYAVLMERPSRQHQVEEDLFDAILVHFPARQLVAETRQPYRFRLYRLK
jgi:hypothetical protein